MQLTKKKAEIIVGAGIRDIHILITAAKMYKSIFTDPKTKAIARTILGDEVYKSTMDMFARMGHLDKYLTEAYKQDRDANKYLNEIEGLTHIEEMAAKVIEASTEIQKQYTT